MGSRSSAIKVSQALRDEIGALADEAGQDEATITARALAEGLAVLRLRRSARDIVAAARASAELDEAEALRIAEKETRDDRHERHQR